MSRTLVVHAGGVGDFVLACPALARLAADGPLTLLGQKERLELAVAAGMAAEARGLDAVDFSSIFATPSARLREFLSGFERAVIWMADDNGKIRAAIEDSGVPWVRCFPGLPPEDWREAAPRYYLRCLGFEEDGLPALPLRSEMRRAEIILHPGSGSPRKNWPMERFAVLAQRLEKAGHAVRWCKGPAEEALTLPHGVKLLEPCSLVELGRRLAGATAYVGNDSGVTHLAAAVGCPTVALFGPSNPAVWGPQGEGVRILRGEPWAEVDEVQAALASCTGLMG